MKLRLLLISILIFSNLNCFSQDTVHHTLFCAFTDYEPIPQDLPCELGINFSHENDSLLIHGTIGANCCGEHLAIIERVNDIIQITTIDTGMLCTCVCSYCFEIKIKASTEDTLIAINGQLYNTRDTNVLIAEAGNDTAFCSSNWEEVSFGGNPSAFGGAEPYTYAWSTEYTYGDRRYSASQMLLDTTVANPVFKEPFIDSATFYLTVTDSDQSVAIDSVKLRFSQFTVCTGDCFHEINIGDSVKLGHCIVNGIPPFHYSWTPDESLSDPASETPWAKPQSNTRYALVYTDSIGCQITYYCEVSVSQLGIQSDDSGSDHLLVYPNPANGIINFSFNHPQYNNSVLKFFGAEGKLVKEILVNSPLLTVDLREFDSGIYIYNWIISDETVGSGKIVIE